MKALSIILLVSLSGFACTKSPLGRRQLIFVPDAQMTNLGEQAFSEMKKNQPVSDNKAVNTWIQCLSRSILEQVEGAEPENWEILVFEDESANAFALPGKKIGVHSGLFRVAETNDQVATVLAHEVAHVLAKHSHERVSKALALQGGMALADALIDLEGSRRQLLFAAIGLGAQVGVVLPHSRKQESEADLIGLDLMTEAGFDPTAAVRLWQNMEKAAPASGPEFLSTHPLPRSRIASLQSRIKKFESSSSPSSQTNEAPNCPRPPVD